MPSKLPFKFSYQVTDTFYAGEYPFKTRVQDGIPKLQRLIDFGIKTIIDLTKEPLTKYAAHLPATCTRLHFPTIDYTSPDFSTLKEIHTLIDEAASRSDKIYVHCKGGYDRTGVVVATYFVWSRYTPLGAKQKFYEAFVPPVRGRYIHRPFIETAWEILERYQEWLEPTPKEPKPVEINHHAVRVLWEGYNKSQQFRRVLYLPYMDGYVMLLVTDAEGKTITTMSEAALTQFILPKKYRDKLPEKVRPITYDPELDER